MPSANDKLKDLLARELRATSEAAVTADGEVDPKRLDRLDRLAKLIEIQKRFRRPSLRQRWPIAAALAISLAFASVLLFARVPATEIELDLRLSEVAFVSPTQQVMSGGVQVATLGVEGLAGLRLPRAKAHAAETVTSPEGGDVAARFEVGAGVPPGSLSLSPLTLLTGTRVWLQLGDGEARSSRLSLEGDDLEARLDVHGPVRIGLAGVAEQPGDRDFATPRSIALQPARRRLDLFFSSETASGRIIAPQLLASDLTLSRIEQFMTLERTIVRPVSTILSGTLFLESIGGKELALRTGERLEFEESTGEIRSLHLKDDHIALQFRGQVRGMSTGSELHTRSLMPTYLEWLQAQHGLSLLWGTALYLFGLIVTLARWWRLPA